MAPELDTAGFLTRHPALWQTAAEVMYGDNITISNSYPSLVRTIDFPTTAETDGDALLMDFVANLTSFLNGTSEQWNITTEWAKTKPANTTDYEILLNITYPILIAKHEVQNLREPFYAEYAAVHDGRVPFIDPSPLTRWNWSDQYPLSAIDDARKNKTIFTDWFSDNVLVPDNETCSNSIMLYVGSEASTSYRNVYLDPPSVPYGFYTGYISPYWGGPDFVLPSKLECFFFFFFLFPISENLLSLPYVFGVAWLTIMTLIQSAWQATIPPSRTTSRSCPSVSTSWRQRDAMGCCLV